MTAIRIERAESGVVTITIDRPPVNAVRFADLAELNERFRELEDDRDVRCVVLTAAGERAFVAGTDLEELAALTPETAEASTLVVQELVNRIYDFPAPVVCAVNGPALGSGVAIAAAADIRIASRRAKFGLPEVDVGVMGGSRHIARLVPQGTARLMMYTGRRLDAQELHRLGAVEAIVEPGELVAEATRLAEEIALKLPIAVRYAKRGLNETEFMPLKEGYAHECRLTSEIRGEPEAVEAGRRYLARITGR